MKTYVSISMAVLVASSLMPDVFGQNARADLDGMPIFGMAPGNTVDGPIGHNALIPYGPYLGLGVDEIASDRARELGLNETRGVEVTLIEANSPAAKAGFKLGDVVMDYNGQAVEDKVQFSRLVKGTPAGRQVKIGVWRAGRRFVLTPFVKAGYRTPSVTAEYRVSQGVSAPVLLQKVQPQYSEQARKAKLEGTVVLSVQVNANGDATHIKVIQSLGLGLDENAIDCVRRWKFEPGYKGGLPVTVEAIIEVSFWL